MANMSNQICVGGVFRFRTSKAAGHSVANKRRKNYTLCNAKEIFYHSSLVLGLTDSSSLIYTLNHAQSH